MKYIIYFLPVLIFLAACSDGDDSRLDPSPMDIERKATDVIDLSSGGLPLALEVGQGEEKNISASWNEVFGRMEITDSDDMSIFVIEDTLSCLSKKEEIEGGVFEVSYLVDTDSLIYYKTMLPDGSASYWHFFASFMVGDAHYVFENNPLIEVTEYQIERMTKLVGNIHPAPYEAK